jgi:hypothetical protein
MENIPEQANRQQFHLEKQMENMTSMTEIDKSPYDTAYSMNGLKLFIF